MITTVQFFKVSVEYPMPLLTEGGGKTDFLHKDAGELAWVWQGMLMWRELSLPPRQVPVEGNRLPGD